ncbi:MAG: hypothetical protein HY580_07625 [Nitrospinae bacterium]|nr:hypothetical protein [Nitrospinota bacterium]
MIMTLVLASTIWLAAGAGVFLNAAPAQNRPPEDRPPDADSLARQALVDTLYYNYEKWFAAFENAIASRESLPPALKTRMELMKYHFYLAGLRVELSRTLAVTSKYKDAGLEEALLNDIRKAKLHAKSALEDPRISREQKATAYFYLGASEGYLGIFEYGAGNYLSALTNGFSADNDLGEALRLDPSLGDAHLGLGIYRYGVSRLGGLGNFLMQGSQDRRLEGIRHIERAIKSQSSSLPLAMKTLIWFYLSEEINPQNAALPEDDPLSPAVCRARSAKLIEEFESRYFKDVPYPGFIGSKDLALMKAVRHSLDGDYAAARGEFEKIVKIAAFLKENKGYKINPQLIRTVEAGVQFSDIMTEAAGPGDNLRANPSLCANVNRQISFIDGGGTLVEYDSRKIRRDIQNVFYGRLLDLSRRMSC